MKLSPHNTPLVYPCSDASHCHSDSQISLCCGSGLFVCPQAWYNRACNELSPMTCYCTQTNQWGQDLRWL
uniref:Uncharacterized protein n=1 Tax=Anguilla anguilla TaxID=7936 RepID=A0A0E9UK61_ANGAN